MTIGERIMDYLEAKLEEFKKWTNDNCNCRRCVEWRAAETRKAGKK